MQYVIGAVLFGLAVFMILAGRGRNGTGATWLGDGLLAITYPVMILTVIAAGIGACFTDPAAFGF